MGKIHTLAFTLVRDEIERDGRSYSIKATTEELDFVKERFNLLSISRLEAEVTVAATGHDNSILVTGKVEADLEQRCIVSLEAVPEKVVADLSVMLVSPEVADRMDDDEVYLDPDAPEYDAIEGDVVEVGDVVAQTVSISMNPYPKRDGAKPDTGGAKNVSVDAPELERKNPFSVLSGLKDKS